MATPKDFREALRRNHRRLGTYLALWAWANKVDCIALPRTELLPYLGLKRMQDDRVDRLTDDVKELFPYSWTTVDSKSNVYATLYLSRKKFPSEGMKKTMNDSKRSKTFTDLGLPTAVADIPKEVEIISSLALQSSGIGSFPKGTK